LANRTNSCVDQNAKEYVCPIALKKKHENLTKAKIMWAGSGKMKQITNNNNAAV